MNITRTARRNLTITLTPREAADVRDDLGEILGSRISQASDRLYGLLEEELESEVQADPDVCCPDATYADYIAHNERGEAACPAAKEAKRAYCRAQYAANPEKAKARKRAYEERKRAARTA